MGGNDPYNKMELRILGGSPKWQTRRVLPVLRLGFGLTTSHLKINRMLQISIQDLPEEAYSMKVFRIFNFHMLLLGTAVAQWLRFCATNRKFAGSIPAGVKWIFH